jgi:3-oxoacyl-[acyl-carrier-protein] synthase-1
MTSPLGSKAGRAARTAYPITGYALCNSIGMNVGEVRTSLRAGECGLGPSPIELPFETVVGAVQGPLPALPEALSPWTTRTTQIARQLLEGDGQEIVAALDRLRGTWRPERIAVLLGTSTAGADVTEQAYRHFLREGALPADYDLFKQHTYGAVLHVVRALTGAEGPAWVISTACTSSAKPLATAQRLIDADLIDAAVVGGIDTLCSMTLHGFKSLDALSAEPTRPFAEDRRGLNIGEGGALLLVERSGEPIALLEGVGESSDAYHISAPHPEGLGARLSMQRALAQAACEADSVSHVNAHGTGTRLNDVSEAAAIESLLGCEVPVVSTKSYTGHMLGAAGGTEAAFSVMAVSEGWIPASLRADPVDEKIHVHIAQERMEGRFDRVLSNSFAFGGNNVSVLVGAPR